MDRWWVRLVATAVGCAVPTVDAEPESHREDTTTWCGDAQRQVDILLVIDDSPSMEQEQDRLAQGLAHFVDRLVDPGCEYDFHLGITTTSVTNPACGTGVDGGLRLRSCLEHIEDFETDGTREAAAVDRHASCTDSCSLDQIETLPTPSTVDERELPRSWIEGSSDGRASNNLPAEVDPAQALTCAGLVGLGGCEFEAPIDAIHRVISRSYDATAPEYGFLRSTAQLLIVIITDEEDCSIADYAILDPAGTRTFWSDPDASTPTSAVCWNAGVECSGDPNGYDRCDPAYLGPTGEQVEPGNAVMSSLEDTVALLEAVRQDKDALLSDPWVGVSVIGGVPDGFYHAGAKIEYAQATDPDFQMEFGIGPGCSSVVDGEQQTGTPPVRLRDFVAAVNQSEYHDRLINSACQDDYTVATTPLACSLPGQIRPFCFEGCAKDVDVDEAGLQPSCAVTQHKADGSSVALEACEPDGDEFAIPAGHDACYVTLVDPNQTGDPNDDLSDGCVEDGYNLQFWILRREDVAHSGCIEATCEVSTLPAVDCPNL